MYACLYARQGVCSADSAAWPPAEQRRGILRSAVCVCVDRLRPLAGHTFHPPACMRVDVLIF